MRSYGITNAAPYAAAPAVGAAGDTYFDTTAKQLYLCDGTQWFTAGGQTLVTSGNLTSGDQNSTVTGNRNAVTAALGNAAKAATILVTADVYFGYASGWVNAQGGIYTNVDAAVHAASPGPIQAAVAAAWTHFGMQWRWTVTAGQDMGFSVQVNIVQVYSAGAGFWYRASCNYEVFQ
jgi:hypothetical protein